jgi:hypothetical protein
MGLAPCSASLWLQQRAAGLVAVAKAHLAQGILHHPLHLLDSNLSSQLELAQWCQLGFRDLPKLLYERVGNGLDDNDDLGNHRRLMTAPSVWYKIGQPVPRCTCKSVQREASLQR